MDVFTVIFIAHTHRLLLVFSFDKTVSSLCRQVRHISFMCHRKKAQPQRPQSHPDTVTFTQVNKCEQVGFILAPFDRLQNRIIIAQRYNSTAGDTERAVSTGVAGCGFVLRRRNSRANDLIMNNCG